MKKIFVLLLVLIIFFIGGYLIFLSLSDKEMKLYTKEFYELGYTDFDDKENIYSKKDTYEGYNTTYSYHLSSNYLSVSVFLNNNTHMYNLASDDGKLIDYVFLNFEENTKFECNVGESEIFQDKCPDIYGVYNEANVIEVLEKMYDEELIKIENIID